jgi:serine/threonine-protein kinase
MPAKVTVTITKGENQGKSWEYAGEARIFVGRADDCAIRLSDPAVSRYHCMMEANPPRLSFYDFGSLNGTWLNGEIAAEGRDASGLSLEDAQKEKHVIFNLKDGDRLGLSQHCELTVNIYEPPYCARCRKEIEKAEEGRFKDDEGGQICGECAGKIEEQKKLSSQATVRVLRPDAGKTAPQPQGQDKPAPEDRGKCLICGAPAGALPPDAARICPKCREDPLAALMFMLGQAAGGNKDAEGIKGYRKIKQLGRGGMGEVWLVEEEATGQKAALKLMLPDIAVDVRCRKGFLREASLGQQLKHENVVTQFKYGNSGDTFFLLQEVCLGGSVDGLMAKMDQKKLPRDLALDIALQMLDGLDYAHNAVVETELSGGKLEKFKGIVHRDIKPQNVFIANEIPLEKLFRANSRGAFETASFRADVYRSGAGVRARAKVADFGLAKAFEAAGNTSMTGKDEAKGSIGFMCRQQLIDVKFAKPEVDVWAAAASLYNMLTGAIPKNIRSERTMYQDVLRGDSVPVRERDSSVDKKLADVIDAALKDKSGLKFKTAAEFRTALESAS